MTLDCWLCGNRYMTLWSTLSEREGRCTFSTCKILCCPDVAAEVIFHSQGPRSPCPGYTLQDRVPGNASACSSRFESIAMSRQSMARPHKRQSADAHEPSKTHANIQYSIRMLSKAQQNMISCQPRLLCFGLEEVWQTLRNESCAV